MTTPPPLEIRMTTVGIGRVIVLGVRLNGRIEKRLLGWFAFCGSLASAPQPHTEAAALQLLELNAEAASRYTSLEF